MHGPDDTDLTEARAVVADEPVPEAAWTAWVPRLVDALALVACCLFILVQLHPSLLVANTTPAGGDMGAHVWGPAYLRDELLPHFRLSGWTPDWYAGFPAYHFYMVVPALAIVALNVGFRGWAIVLPLVVVALGLLVAVRRWLLGRPRSEVLAFVALAAVVAVLGIGMPYGVAFKLVTVAGLIALPVCAYAFGRLADLPFPAPVLMAAATVPFVFNREPILNGTGNIIGGNATSTLAGEFSFSLSLAFCVLYLGVLMRGLQTGKHRSAAAVLLGLTALCHIIPAIYALTATVVAFAVWPSRGRLRWLATMLPVGAMIAAFWALPFVLRRVFLNDMGWRKLPEAGARNADGTSVTVWDYLLPNGLRWAFVLALVGLAVAVVVRSRVGIFLAGCAVAMAVAFVIVPQGRLWNARLLPFYYLCVLLLAAVGVAEVARAVAQLVVADPRRPSLGVRAGVPGVATLAALVIAGLPMGIVPGQHRTSEGGYEWLGFTVSPSDRNPARDWARWNYTGYERKPAYPEYHALMETMAGVGAREGCGRAMWEYENDRLNSYGTPMSPMLLPFWTKGCIGSMEGLFFEASATTPYHFLNQSELSAKPSRAQRDLPYTALDIPLGVQHLQLMGVRYYLAFSLEAVNAAALEPSLDEIATSGPWHVYEVEGSELVSPLSYEPAVLSGVTDGKDFLKPAVDWYVDPSRWDVALATSGPRQWTRVDIGETPPKRPLEPVVVSDIDAGDSSISFDVDRVGVPVLVKASYFPNWQVSGAKGPYRVAPNLMVVVPTSEHVELRYGWTLIDASAYLFTAAGILFAIVLARQPAVSFPLRRRREADPVPAV